jgi:hypothetical protein
MAYFNDPELRSVTTLARDLSIQHADHQTCQTAPIFPVFRKAPSRTDPIYPGGLGSGAGRTKPAYKRHILPRPHPHSKTGYALENQLVFELTGM